VKPPKRSSSALVESEHPCYGVVVNVSDEILDFLVEQIPAQSLANFKASDEARQRVWSLIAKEKESGLLPEEKVELDDYLKLEHLVVLAKAKALAARHG
jgi:hypothetical protein